MVLFGADHKPVAAVQLKLMTEAESKEQKEARENKGLGAAALDLPGQAAAVAGAAVASASASAPAPAAIAPLAHSRAAVMFNTENVPITYVLTNFTDMTLQMNVIKTDSKGESGITRMNEINVVAERSSLEVKADYSAKSKQLVLQKQAPVEGKFVTVAQDAKAAGGPQCLFMLVTVVVPEPDRVWANQTLPNSYWKSDVEHVVVKDGAVKSTAFASFSFGCQAVPNFNHTGALRPPQPPARASFGAGDTFGEPQNFRRGMDAKHLDPIPKGMSSIWEDSHIAQIGHGEEVAVHSTEYTTPFAYDRPAKRLLIQVGITGDMFCLSSLSPPDLKLAEELIEIAILNLEARVALAPFVSDCCVVCLEQVPIMTTYPCAHRCLCGSCFARLVAEDKIRGRNPRCPLCRTAALAARKDPVPSMPRVFTKTASVPYSVVQRERALFEARAILQQQKYDSLANRLSVIVGVLGAASRMAGDPNVDMEVLCPKGHQMKYGKKCPYGSTASHLKYVSCDWCNRTYLVGEGSISGVPVEVTGNWHCDVCGNCDKCSECVKRAQRG